MSASSLGSCDSSASFFATTSAGWAAPLAHQQGLSVLDISALKHRFSVLKKFETLIPDS